MFKNVEFSLNDMIKVGASSLASIKFPEKAQMEAFGTGLDTILATIDKIADFGEGFTKRNITLIKFGAQVDKWKTSKFAPHEIDIGNRIFL